MVKRSVFIPAILLALYGCASRDMFTETEIGDAYVRFNADQFHGLQYKNIRHTGQLDREEYSLYVGHGGQAEFIYMEATQTDTSLQYNHDQSERIHKLIDTWNYNKGHDKEWGKTRRLRSSLGSVHFKPYRLTGLNQQCAGISIQHDYAPDDPQQRPVQVVFGYLCQKGNTVLSDEKMVSYIEQISIRDAYRDFKISSESWSLNSPTTRTTEDSNKSYAALVNGGFIPGTGNNRFPFKLSYFYSSGGGTDRF